MDSRNCSAEANWISLILRLSIASLFLVAAIAKFTAGIDITVAQFQQAFKGTWLPPTAVTFQASIIPYVEILIPVWLLIGYRLRLAWVITSLVALSLAFGMAVLRGYGVAADNFFYVLLCCFGLYFSSYDKFSIDGLTRNK